MPGARAIVHKKDGGHEIFRTHECYHCGERVLCSQKIDHDPETCPVGPQFTCGECRTNIFAGKFKFGKRYDDCVEACDMNDKKKFFEHAKKCAHHPDTVFKDLSEKVNG